MLELLLFSLLLPPLPNTPQSTGTDLTATEIKSGAVGAGHLNLTLQNAEQDCPYPETDINTC